MEKSKKEKWLPFGQVEKGEGWGERLEKEKKERDRQFENWVKKEYRKQGIKIKKDDWL